MKYANTETHDFKCRHCKSTWLKYVENNNPCNNSILGNGRHDFDFAKPIRMDKKESQISTRKVLKGNITFQ